MKIKYRISTILCIVLLAIQLNALVRAEEEQAAVSGNDFMKAAINTNTVAGTGEVLTEPVDSEDSMPDKEDDEDSTLSGNDVSENDADGEEDMESADVEDTADVSENDVSGNDVSDNDVSGNDISGNDVSDNDVSGNDISGNDVSDNNVSNHDAADGDVGEESGNNPGQALSGNDAVSDNDAISGNKPKKLIDPDALKIITLRVPRNLNFVIDPWEINGKGSIWSQEYVFSNNGKAPVELKMRDIKCSAREGIFCAGSQVSPEEVIGASGKAVQMKLELSNGEVIYVTEDGGSYETIVDAGESFTLTVIGIISDEAKEQWQDGDLSLSLSYAARVCEPKEE